MSVVDLHLDLIQILQVLLFVQVDPFNLNLQLRLNPFDLLVELILFILKL